MPHPNPAFRSEESEPSFITPTCYYCSTATEHFTTSAEKRGWQSKIMGGFMNMIIEKMSFFVDDIHRKNSSKCLLKLLAVVVHQWDAVVHTRKGGPWMVTLKCLGGLPVGCDRLNVHSCYKGLKEKKVLEDSNKFL
ncbi:hypothetical protein TNCV_4868161 [Trichonephila clavipes]|nr:hypothetical protein TNCV_4868161 [Trichonephila clavipes]